MPCYTEPHSYCKHGISKSKNAVCDLEKTFHELKKCIDDQSEVTIHYRRRCDLTTRLLCKVLKSLDKDHAVFNDVEIFKWHENHQEWDKERVELEKKL